MCNLLHGYLEFIHMGSSPIQSAIVSHAIINIMPPAGGTRENVLAPVMAE